MSATKRRADSDVHNPPEAKKAKTDSAKLIPCFKDDVERRIVGFGVDFTVPPTNPKIFGDVWRQYHARKADIRSPKTPSVLYGVSSGHMKMRYVSGVEVEPSEVIPEGMEAVTLPAGHYAVFSHHGCVTGIQDTLRYIHGTWIPSSGVRVRMAPWVERYDERFSEEKPDESVFDIYVPIEKDSVKLVPAFKDDRERKIVGFGGDFTLPPDPKIFGDLWRMYHERKAEIASARAPDVTYGVTTGDHKNMHYIAGVEVDSTDLVPAGMEAVTLPAGHYAVFTHRGCVSGVQATYRQIDGTWIPTSGAKCRAAPWYELYDERFSYENPSESAFDILVPIEMGSAK